MQQVRATVLVSAAFALVALGCSKDSPTAAALKFTDAPCSATGTVSLEVAQTTRVDCSNGGTTVTLAGGGASYLVVAQFAASLVPNEYVQYRLSSGTAVAPAASRIAQTNASRSLFKWPSPSASGATSAHNHTAQLAFDRALRTRARQRLASGSWQPSLNRPRNMLRAASASASVVANDVAPPAVGSTRSFRVTNAAGTASSGVIAKLAYAGASVLLYMDTLAPANGFTPTQLQNFGQLFDQTLYPIDTAAFGPPSDIDGNGRVIMLMSPAVNAITSTAQCQSQGYVAGFFEEGDLAASPGDPDSNFGEIFYSVVPDSNGVYSCPHTVGDVDFAVPSTFMHELQHLISFSQHAVVHGGRAEYGWLDEGLSIVAEELGSLYYEQKCPPPSCRTSAAQIFPDSSQGFIENFLYNSYQYAFLPDTASLTLHEDFEDGFSWRGGDWLMMRWLGDQFGTQIFRKLDESSVTGVANIVLQAGKPFPELFADFGVALVTDSMPGLARTTAPPPNRFVTRNMRQLWARLFTTSAGSDVPLSFPVQLFTISADTSLAVMDPGTMSFFRLDTPSKQTTVSLQFAGPGGAALPASVVPQLVIFRLPPGQ